MFCLASFCYDAILRHFKKAKHSKVSLSAKNVEMHIKKRKKEKLGKLKTTQNRVVFFIIILINEQFRDKIVIILRSGVMNETANYYYNLYGNLSSGNVRLLFSRTDSVKKRSKHKCTIESAKYILYK